jgi:hypothetical protein
MNQETIQKQIASYTGDNLASFLYELLTQEQKIKAERREVELAITRVKCEATKTIQKCRANLDKIQQQCPHIETKFYPDASGGNDSERHCLWCGKNL